MNLQTQTKQIQKQQLAPVMQKSIEILLLSLIDLNTSIEQELQNNPLLEVNEDSAEASSEITEKTILNLAQSEISYQGSNFDDEVMEDWNTPIKEDTCLEDLLLQQLRVELSDPLELSIGEMIIGNLDEDGYLQSSCEEIAQAVKTENIALVERILSIVQAFEPVGIASRNLSECLLTQIKFKNPKELPLLSLIITDHLSEIGTKKFQHIARKLRLPVDHIKNATRMIASLEPKPARNYRPIRSGTYIKPDIFITKNELGEFTIKCNKSEMPILRISPFYRKMLTRNKLSPEEKKFIHEKLKDAIHFIKSIELRGHTLQRIAEFILNKQRPFFENDAMTLGPMTLKDVAQDIDRNESTISRAIHNKYIDTPKGIFPLSFFFSQGIAEKNNGVVASRTVKEELKELIEEEDKSSPLSDQAIQTFFEKKGLHIARRTINKYRQSLHILPAHLRKT